MKCLIVEDDPLICDLLKHFCDKSGRVEYAVAVGECREGLQILSTERFDVVFLDFNLPDMTGKEFLELMPEDIPVIMVTSHKDFAVDSYNYPRVVDFLAKPIDYPRFLKGLDRLQKGDAHEPSLEATEDLFVKDGHALVKIHLPTISHIKSEGNYVRFFTPEGSVLTLGSLSNLLEDLPGYFLRCHRSYLVNLNKIDSIHTDGIHSGDHQIPLSGAYKEDILNRIKAL